MSSLAASRADNFYHPPEWDPQKIGRDRYQGSKGSNQWEKYGVIRFEMPYNIWCGGCKKHIRKGTRFNAKKLDAGKYFTTKIYEFHMKCACCPQKIVIRTDPQNRDYAVVSGGRRKIETYTEESAEVERLSTADERLKLADDPFYRLEHSGHDSAARRQAVPRLQQLLELRDQQHGDDFGASQQLRRAHRSRRHREAEAAATQARSAAPLIPLLQETGEDRRRASLVKFKRRVPDAFERSRIQKRTAVKAGSIFGSQSLRAQKRVEALVKVRSRGVDAAMFAARGGGSGGGGSSLPRHTRAAALDRVVVVRRK
eukprot:COSAG01_NODE_3170_length_6472_cov_2.238820_4_plen_313_part_00